MSALTTESQEWLWDFTRHKARVRHWPAITQGLVHVHDITDLAPLRRFAAQAEAPDEWLRVWAQTLPSTEMSVAVDTLGDMLDQNREQCLGDAIGLKGHSDSLFALARGEILTQLPFPARLALLSEGLAIIDADDLPAEPRTALQELTVADLQKLAEPLTERPNRMRKGELVDALCDAAQTGQISLPLGPIKPAPALQPWLQQRIEQYVEALRDGLNHRIYPHTYREAVWRQALEEAHIEPLRKALEIAYWQVLERDLNDPTDGPMSAENQTSSASSEPQPSQRWQPGLSRSNQDIAWVWLGLIVLVLFVGWLW